MYLFDRNTVTVKKGTATAVSLPHYNTQPNTNLGIGMVVDVTVAVDGNSGQYVVKDASETAYANNGTLLITPNIDNVLGEIRAIKAQSEEVLNSIDTHKDNVAKCDKLLADLDPVFKKEQASEQRFSKIEDAIMQLAKNNAAQAESSKKIEELLTKLTRK